jgi:mannosyltransferase OCH1-like enzyme
LVAADPTIPPIIHQVWKTETIPPHWRGAVASVRRYHPGWQYELWSDERAAEHVRRHHPDLYPIFMGFERPIMRADVIRYVLMHDLGGLYCDLDYEFIRPFDYRRAPLVLSLERDVDFGDSFNQVANYVFASAPGHPLWRAILDDLIANPPDLKRQPGIVKATGPQLVTRIFYADPERYAPFLLTPRPALSPHRMRSPHERAMLLNSGQTFGFHHGWGNWKQRWRAGYWRRKIRRLLGDKR